MFKQVKRFRNISDIYKFELKTNKTELNSTIHRRLLLRLIIATFLISIVLAAAAFFIEFHRVGNLVSGRASQVVLNFNDQVRTILDSPEQKFSKDLQNELKMLLIAGKSKQWMGQLVYSSIYDLQGREIVTEMDVNYRQLNVVEGLAKSLTHQLPNKSQKAHKIKYINRIPYILLSFPLTNSSGKKVAAIEGVFAVSKVARDEVFERIRGSVFGTISIVVLTSLILYPIIITLIRQLSRVTDNLIESNIETLRVVGSAIAKRDSDTDSHNYRVTIYSVALAEKIGLKPSLIRGLVKGAFLHDVGKIGVSDQILLKPGKLSDEEFEEMKTHVNHGIDIVERSEWLKDARDVVGYHHEKYSGNGYPHGIDGSSIPVNARIFAIVDVFDALISIRPYKDPMSFDTAIKILEEGRGNHFDPFHLDAFIDIARSLYDTFANCSENTLRRKLESIIQEYFSREYRFVE
jgi:HD-GYP domain-containing protein (c-di-GMP phosphodiesterase class II)